MTTDLSDWPIVVGGCHRSGTSLVRRILDSHSAIHCGPEVPFFRDFYGEYDNDPYAHLRFSQAARSLLPEDELLEVLSESLVALHERAAAKAAKRRWADKAPENVLHVEGWDQVLSGRCQFVLVVRNPLDTLASMSEHPFPLTVPRSIDDRIIFYRAMTEAALAAKERKGERCLLLSYETLVANPERTVAELMGWLGERPEQVQLAFNSVGHQLGLEDPNVARTSRVHGQSVGAWRRRLESGDALRIWHGTRDTWARVDPSFQSVVVP